MFEELGFQALVDEFAEPLDVSASSSKESDVAESTYETVLTADGLDEVVAACREAGRFSVVVVGDGPDPMRSGLVGIGLSAVSEHAWYLPVGHRYLGAPEQLTTDAVSARLGPLMADGLVAKVGHDLCRGNQYNVLFLG